MQNGGGGAGGERAAGVGALPGVRKLLALDDFADAHHERGLAQRQVSAARPPPTS